MGLFKKSDDKSPSPVRQAAAPPPPASSSGSSPKPRAAVRGAQRDISHAQRDLDRTMAGLKRDEAKLMADIKAEAKRGNQASAKVLAKSLVKNRQQQQRITQSKAQMTGISHNVSAQATNAQMANVMGEVGGVMNEVNALNDPKAMMKNIQAYEMNTMKMEMNQELIDDAFGMFDDEMTGESDQVLASVLDEIGLEYGSKIGAAPVGRVPAPQGVASMDADAEMEAMIARLARE